MNVGLSRPAALAARLAAIESSAALDLFTTKRVVCRLDPDLSENTLAHQALLLAANQTLRFCPRVSFELGTAAAMLEPAIRELAASIHEEPAIAFGADEGADVTLNVGRELPGQPDWISINGHGWLARIANSAADAQVAALPPGFEGRNGIGGLAAACLGAGQVFSVLIGTPLPAGPVEFSAWTLQQGEPGQLDEGPEVAFSEIDLDALLVGCGAVANGWIYAAREAGSRGRLEAVDNQAQRAENIGPYVCATRARIGDPKVRTVKQELEPWTKVIERPERFRFFRARIGYGQTYIPEVVLTALDNAPTRRDGQRLWAHTTIDLAAEELTAQVIVKKLDDDGQCLLEAYTDPGEDEAELEALAAETGLKVERLRAFETPITENDVAAAPPAKRASLERARQRGQLVCGRVGDLDLHEEEYTDQFTPAVPFVTCFTGIVAYAQTVRARLDGVESFHFQFSFRSYRSRVLHLRRRKGCECSR